MPTIKKRRIGRRRDPLRHRHEADVSELLSCPFCGAHPIECADADTVIACSNRACQLSTFGMPEEDWNRRTSYLDDQHLLDDHKAVELVWTALDLTEAQRKKFRHIWEWVGEQKDALRQIRAAAYICAMDLLQSDRYSRDDDVRAAVDEVIHIYQANTHLGPERKETAL